MNSIERIARALMVLLPITLFVSSNAQAWPSCETIFSSTYNNSETANLAGCQTCHASSGGGGTFNLYGNDLLSNGANGAGFNCDLVNFAAVLVAVQDLDSDLEGNSNIVEIDANTQPGWCDTTLNSGCTNPVGTPPNVALDPAPTNSRPLAVVGGPYFGEAGTTLVQFDGSASSDPDLGDTLTYAWDFGDGSNATGMMPTHIYNVAGDFQVTLIVNDQKVDSAASITSAAISPPPANLAPTADIGGPYIGEPEQAVLFDGSASSDPNGDTLNYAWDFGDGAMGSGIMPSHIYAAAGTYAVSLIVNDGRLESNAATTTAEIAVPPANRAPIADAGGPYSGDTGAVITFNGTASSDADGDPLTYSWDFGDGATGTGVTPPHDYAVAGSYAISLVVNDGEFDSSVATSTAEITDRVAESDGEVLYNSSCAGCHSDPWEGPAVDDSLLGLRRVAGARNCSIRGSIFGTSVFPNGVAEMQFLQGLTENEIGAVADYLNSRETSGERRYVTACAGCHGNQGSGGRVGEDVHGDSADETAEAINEEQEMRYLACMPASDINAIAEFLRGFDDDADDDGIGDDEDDDDDNDGIPDNEDSDDDNDGMSDDDERDDGTDPRDEDSDDDRVNDGDEHEDGTDPLDSDSDDDGLTDGDERDRGTDPMDVDTDDDGKTDGDEVNVFHTNPLVADNAALAVAPGNGGGSPSLLFLVLLTLVSVSSRMLQSNRSR